jgi:RNA polymerase sigma-70 factor (ECF subfamily)
MSTSQFIPVGTLSATLARGVGEGAGGLKANHRLLERVWPRQAGPLAAMAVGLGLRREAVTDVLQEVYLEALRRPPAIVDQAGDEEAGLVRWLVRVTANRCHLEHRRAGRWRRAWTALAGTWRGAWQRDGEVAVGELKREVDRALAQLPEGDRLLVVLRYFANRNSREIAQIVEQPESTVRGRLRLARQRLAELLADWKLESAREGEANE